MFQNRLTNKKFPYIIKKTNVCLLKSERMRRDGDFVSRMLGGLCNCGTVCGRGSQTSGTRKEKKTNPDAEQTCRVCAVRRRDNGYKNVHALRRRYLFFLCNSRRLYFSGASWRRSKCECCCLSKTRSTIESMAHTLSTVGVALDDIVQLNFYIKRVFDFRKGADVFREYFKNGAPARMTVVTDFVGSTCLSQMDGIAYLPQQTK